MLLPWNQSEIVPSLSRQCPRGASLSLNQVTTWSRVLGLVPGSKTDDRRTRGLEGLVLPGWMGFRVCLFLSHFIFCSNSFFLSSGIPSKICRSSILGSCVHRHTIGEMETLTTALLMEGGNGKYYSPHKQMENGECQLQTKLQLAHMK